MTNRIPSRLVPPRLKKDPPRLCGPCVSTAWQCIFSLLLGIVVLVEAALSQRASAYTVQDPASFPVIHAHCTSPAKGKILTSVGKFSDNFSNTFEVVADTRIAPLDNSIMSGFQSPSISLFDRRCQLVWLQSYPSFSEVGFEVLKTPGGPVLFVSAVDLEFADQTVFDNELLASYGEGSIQSIVSFGSDKFQQSYVGFIYADGGFGVATILDRWGKGAFPVSANTALAYRWEPFSYPINPRGPSSLIFVGPNILNAKEVATLKLPLIPQHPPYPLFQFVYGFANPG